MSTTTIRIQGTEAQFQDFESRCEVTELMLAQTLCRRYQIDPTQENLGIVAGWMSTARSMGIANHVTSGIRMEQVDDQAKPQTGESGWLRQHAAAAEKAAQLCALIESSGASPELTEISIQASSLYRTLIDMVNAE